MDTHDLGRLFVHPARLADDAPVFHRALTAEYNDPGRYSNSLVIKTPFMRDGRWHGIRKSWLSAQAKLPTGPRVWGSRWAIVVGWWRDPEYDDGGYSTLLRATRLGHDLDGDDERNFSDPTSESISSALIEVDRRRTEPDADAGADG